MKRNRMLPPFFAFALALALPLLAQEAGSIQGLIIDPQHAAVPGVTVTIEERGTGIERTTSTNSDGLYSFPSVAIGTYTVTAEARGFKKVVAPDVVVEVAQKVRIDLAVEIGTISETVAVTATPPQLQTSDSQLGGVVESKAISDLPLNGRSFTQLMVLMAGSTERATGTAAGHYAEREAGVAFSVNGQRQTANQFLIDGFMAKEVQDGTNSVEPILCLAPVPDPPLVLASLAQKLLENKKKGLKYSAG
jgi:hypothetical protein